MHRWEVIDNRDVDNHAWIGGVLAGMVGEQRAGGCSTGAAGPVLFRMTVGSRAGDCSGVRHRGVGPWHVGLRLIRQRRSRCRVPVRVSPTDRPQIAEGLLVFEVPLPVSKLLSGPLLPHL